MEENLAWRMGAGAVLAGIAFLAYATDGVQHGPKWEVPAEAATNLLFALIASFVFDVVAVLTYFLGNRFKSQTTIARRGFWLVLTLGVTAPIAIYILEPEQWPTRNPHLSVVARAGSVPIVIACAILWVLFLVFGRKRAVRSI